MSDPTPSTRFDDGKAADALRTIGEVAGALDIKQHILRYWEQQFPALKPLKRSGGRRYYRPQDVALVEQIDRLINREGYTLRGARQVIENGGGQTSIHEPSPVDHPAGPDRSELLAQLQALRDRLDRALGET